MIADQTTVFPSIWGNPTPPAFCPTTVVVEPFHNRICPSVARHTTLDPEMSGSASLSESLLVI